MTYSVEAASAYESVADAGTAVTFTRVAQAESVSTGLLTTTITTISGYAIEVSGDPDTYERLALIEKAPATLFFIPTTYGDAVRLGDTVTWNYVSWIARDVNPLAPDGTVIGSRVVVTAGSDQQYTASAFSSDFSGAFA